MTGKKKWLKRGIWIALALIVVVGVAYSLTNSKKQEYDQETAKTRDIETFYTFSGNIEPDEIEMVYAASNNKITKVYVLEGDTVAEDANLFKMQSGTVIESPLKGTVTDVYVKVDDTVRAGDSIARVATYDKPIVTISIDEYDISSIHVGDKVTVYIQAMNKTVEGVIEKIKREANVTSNVAYYQATVAIEQDGTILMGMTCEVSALKESALGVTTIPLSYVNFDEDNQPFLYLYNRNNEVIAEYMTLGVSNGTTVQVVEGLKSGETVLSPKNRTTMFMPFAAMRNR